MKKLLIILAILPLALSVQAAGPRKLKFEYDAYYEYYFENREFDKSGSKYFYSSTINSMVLTPSAGFSFYQNRNLHHRLGLGIDLRRDMGAGPQNYQILDEVTINYDVHARLGNGALFEGILGVLPRHYSEGEYSEFFASDSLLFADRNIDGILLKYKTPRFYAELGEDWMGKGGPTRRERFMFFSAGAWSWKPWLKLGWDAFFYHYAGSEQAPGVVDLDYLHPYVKADFAYYTDMQELSLKAGPMLSYQWDRKQEEKQSTPCGAELVLTARKWNVSLQNTSYFGSNLQYLYNNLDTGGIKYGHDLYFGNPWYRGFFDSLKASWEPNIAPFLKLRVAARFTFDNSGFIGSQQYFGFIFNLDKYRHPKMGAGRIGNFTEQKKGIPL